MAYWILKAVLKPVFFLFWRLNVEGRENVPETGPAIVAANHQSFCDSFFLPLALPRRVTFVAKAEYFDDWKTAWFFRAAGQIPMHRGGGDRSQRALDAATEVLAGGDVLGIYPEGTRAPDTRLHRGHTGVARLALGCRVPVIPVGILGTREIQPPGRRLMRVFHPVTIRLGPPLSADDLAMATEGASVAPGPEQLRRFTDALMQEIAKLSGQEYVDTYANRKKDETCNPGDNGAPGTAAARVLQARLRRIQLATVRKLDVHSDRIT